MGVYLWLYYFFSFSLYISLFLFCSLSLISLVLVQVKQVRGLYRVFIIKIKGNGEFVQGEVILKKRMSNNKADKLGFTASPGKSATDHAVFQMSI